MSAAIGLYRALSRAALRPVLLHLRRRAARGKEDPARLGERLGEASVSRPTGPLVWLHAASVGECVSVLPLVARLLDDPALSVLVTSNTVTSAQLMADRLPPRALHQYAPVDLPGAVERFVDHWRPGLALFVESELWPNLISALRARAVPMAIVQGRLSARSWRRWRRCPAAARQLLGGFRMVIAQTAEDAARYSRLGAPVVRPLGTLKYAAEPLPADAAALAALRRAVGDRPRWVAASTHPGTEEDAVFIAHIAARTRVPGLLTVVVPRHPVRGGDVARAAHARGLGVAQRTAGAAIRAATDVYVADTLGELGLLYRLAPLAFVGGTLSGRGGHNPIEPIRLGCATVAGPDLRNFRDVADDLRAAAALETVADRDALAKAVGDLLLDEPERARLATRQRQAVEARTGVLDAVAAALEPLVPRCAAV